MPVRLAMWLCLKYTQRDVSEYVDNIWEYIYKLDSYVFGYLGFHFAHWDISIRDKCYNCRRLKTNALQRKAAQVNNAFTVKMSENLQKGIKKMNDGAAEFRGAFM
jgi:hypothetical protein